MVKFFLNNRINKLAKAFVREKCFLEFKDVQNIVILFDMEDLVEVEAFVEVLESDGKNVTAYSLDLRKNSNVLVLENFRVWIKTHFNVFGLLKQPYLDSFRQEACDTLIDLTGETSLLARYLFLNSPARYRVGFHRGNSELYDLLIERNEEHDFSFFANQLLFYMKRLHSK